MTVQSGFLQEQGESSRRDRSLETTGAEFAALSCLAGAYAISEGFLGPESYDSVNFYGPMALMAILARGAWRMLRSNSANIWAALFWFRISTIVYFGFGQFAPFIMNDASLLYLNKYYAPQPQEILKLNLLVALGVIAVLLGAQIYAKIAPPRFQQMMATPQEHAQSMRRTGLLLLCIGGAIKYLYVFPQAMGWTTDVLPGAVAMLSSLSLAGIYLLTLWALSIRNWTALFFISTFVIVEMTSGLLLFTKAEAMLPLIVYLIAIISQKASLQRFLLAAASLVFLFMFLVPIVTQGRDEINRRSPERGQVSIAERLEIIWSVVTAPEQFGEEQNSLLRISYLSPATFAIARYDAGQPAATLDLIWVIFIPRFIWPEKPILDIGKAFSTEYSGMIRENSVAPGIFADLYWSMGWYGLVFLVMPFGLLFAYFSRFAQKVMHKAQYTYMPVLFLMMRWGLTIDNATLGLLGGAILIFALQALLMLVERARLITSVRGATMHGAREC
ncbi:hypothetical protein [Methylocystis sp. SC2]|uniref:hypothetical protein n=1 Tax=Methylocystis sp. (strain SC2) TaxID=187303 RepID=UPI00027AF3CE|nr:hypothetical protein [Methylocystis sp. SC2]CCJ07829.1 Sec-independent protein translocase, TatC subunit [Methylocystis sp. SC2]